MERTCELIQKNIQQINHELAKICARINRNPEAITIVAVTKNVDAKEAEKVITHGITHIGENRPDSFLQKYDALKEKAIWHFIGTLQSRKVKAVINQIDYLHSLDRLSLAKEINKHANQKVKCFVQVKTSAEETKHGLAVEEVVAFVREIGQYEKIEVVGLMTMAPFTEDVTLIRSSFSELKKCQEKIQSLNLDYAPCTELSMGMSGDYEIAIEEGATFIRLGTSLVGK